MQPGKVRCAQCGWQNDVGDRMCGGCGQPLFHSGSSFGAAPDHTPTIASSGAVASPPPPLSPDTRTASWSAQGYPRQFSPQTATVAATPLRGAAPFGSVAGSQPQSKSSNCLGRALISLAVAAALLVVMLACGWAAVVRPAIHRSLDQSLRTGLVAQVTKVPPIPPGYAPITRTITDTELNRQARAGNPQNDQGDMKDIRVHFLPGEVTMTYLLWGKPGKISTNVVAVNGRLLVQNTQVDGWLAQFETGDELQDALNSSLARLPAQDYVESVIVGNGTLTIAIRHA
ncbi:MAG TPA: zinc ribbon domain-containing protein [Ktedonobacterales bacterium]|nr:zinc ribbon domain-containing protein [Ktedonobacterales bacterium]